MAFVKRHLAKAVSYRCLGTAQTLVISYVLTGSMKVASAAGTIEFFLKPLMYFIHERVWFSWIRFGLTTRSQDDVRN